MVTYINSENLGNRGIWLNLATQASASPHRRRLASNLMS